MYKGDIYIQPRCTGKTTSMINSMDDNDIILVNNESYVHVLKVNFFTKKDKIFNINKLYLEGRRNIKNIYVDEYFYWTTNQKLWFNNLLNVVARSVEKVIVKSTSDKLYDEKLIQLIRIIKMENLPLKYLDERLPIDEYNINLLTNPNFEIHQWREDLKEYMTKEKFEIEALGQLYKEK